MNVHFGRIHVLVNELEEQLTWNCSDMEERFSVAVWNDLKHSLSEGKTLDVKK